MGQELLRQLKKLRFTRNNYQGICSQVRTNETVLFPLFRKWPHFSGCTEFPVPDPDYPKNAAQAEKMYLGKPNINKWDREAAYGKLRWDLLEFMIAELEKEHV